MQVKDALAHAGKLGVDRRDARRLLQAVLERPATWLLANDDHGIAPAQRHRFERLLLRHADGEPMAYLLGVQEFHGLTLRVTPATLVPRPDTETLVDWALTCLPPTGSVLDLGTGSGAIALALKHQRPDAHVSASDISELALGVARANGIQLNLDVQWLGGSWWEAVAPGRQFDLIVSNPPYIAQGDPHLPALRHEPQSALTAGPDGLEDLRTLISSAQHHLVPGGWLLLEHGHDQADAVADLFVQAKFLQVEHRQDLAGHRRCTGAKSVTYPAI
jgi:release factor glutamine methyltransferase